MKQFFSVADVADPWLLINEALRMKESPLAWQELGRGKTLGALFMNPSLRTRLSTEKAARNLGMDVQMLSSGGEAWAWETREGAIMNGDKVEHIKDAAMVMGRYFDILALRSFPALKNREEDESESLFRQVQESSGKPLISLESATRHPLQSLADAMTIVEHSRKKRPKVVLCWAPHIKPIPQVVANSFAEWMLALDMDLSISHPEGYELADIYTKGATIEYNRAKALEEADFVYVKNWSSYHEYGRVLPASTHGLLQEKDLAGAPEARIMHCLPVRRNVELSDELLDGPRALTADQAENRIYAAQAVLKQILESQQKEAEASGKERVII